MKMVLFNLLAVFFLALASFVESDVDDNASSANQSVLEHKQYPYRFLKISDANINQLPLLLDSATFFKNCGPVDSTFIAYWDCGSPLEWLDAAWMEQNFGKMDAETGTFEHFDGMITTLFVNKTIFTTNKHAYLFQKTEMDRVKFQILSARIELTDKISVAEFKKYFPKAVEEPLEQSDEIRFRISIEEGSDDAFLFDFKNGRLSSIELWWLLC